MTEEFNSAQLRIIGMMSRASRTLPDDFWAVAAMQELACVIAEIEPLLTDEQAATLIGCGAFIIHQGRDETIAGIQAAIALSRARQAI